MKNKLNTILKQNLFYLVDKLFDLEEYISN